MPDPEEIDFDKPIDNGEVITDHGEEADDAPSN